MELKNGKKEKTKSTRDVELYFVTNCQHVDVP